MCQCGCGEAGTDLQDNSVGKRIANTCAWHTHTTTTATITNPPHTQSSIDWNPPMLVGVTLETEMLAHCV